MHRNRCTSAVPSQGRQSTTAPVSSPAPAVRRRGSLGERISQCAASRDGGLGNRISQCAASRDGGAHGSRRPCVVESPSPASVVSVPRARALDPGDILAPEAGVIMEFSASQLAAMAAPWQEPAWRAFLREADALREVFGGARSGHRAAACGREVGAPRRLPLGSLPLPFACSCAGDCVLFTRMCYVHATVYCTRDCVLFTRRAQNAAECRMWGSVAPPPWSSAADDAGGSATPVPAAPSVPSPLQSSAVVAPVPAAPPVPSPLQSSAVVAPCGAPSVVTRMQAVASMASSADAVFGGPFPAAVPLPVSASETAVFRGPFPAAMPLPASASETAVFGLPFPAAVPAAVSLPVSASETADTPVRAEAARPACDQSAGVHARGAPVSCVARHFPGRAAPEAALARSCVQSRALHCSVSPPARASPEPVRALHSSVTPPARASPEPVRARMALARVSGRPGVPPPTAAVPARAPAPDASVFDAATAGGRAHGDMHSRCVRAWRYAFPYVRAWRYAFPLCARMAMCIPVCARMTICIPVVCVHDDVHSRMCAHDDMHSRCVCA